MRKIFSIRIDPNVWKAAREKGINISRTCENALKHAVQKGGNLGTVGSVVVRPPGFEPGLSAREAGVLDQARLRPPTKHRVILVGSG